MTTEIAPENTGAAIWGRLVEPSEGNLSPEAAHAWLNLKFSREDHERVEHLSEKTQQGRLSEQDQVELDEYIRVSAELAVIQSKARISLKRAGSKVDSPE